MRNDSFLEQEMRAEGRSLGDEPQQFAQPQYQQNFTARGQVYAGRSKTTNDAALVFKIVGGVFMGIGALIIAIGFIVTYFMQQNYDKCTETVTAVVVKNIKKEDTYTPVFAYTVDGKDYEQKSSYSTNPPKYDIGDEVELHYEPGKPTNFYVDKAITLVRIVLYSIGGFFFVFGFVFVIVGIKAKIKGERL